VKLAAVIVAVLLVGLTSAQVRTSSNDDYVSFRKSAWVYDSIRKLTNDKLLVGFDSDHMPEGWGRHHRPASRYEIAVAVHATTGHARYLAKLMSPATTLPPRQSFEHAYGVEGDVELNKAKSDPLLLSTWVADLRTLEKLMLWVKPQLAVMGVDVVSLRAGIRDCAKSFQSLLIEARKRATNSRRAREHPRGRVGSG
jgi:hypothetical protein